MHVDAVLILGLIIGYVVSEAEHAGEFLPGLRIEVSVTKPAIHGTVPDADIGQAAWVVGSDRYVSCEVDHVVVDACVPAQRKKWKHVSEAPQRVVDHVGA
jgi:hypothetical protein